MTSVVEFPGAIPVWTLSDRLRKAREARGAKQTDLADALDVSRRTVVNYENGLVEPKRLVVKMWAMATGVDSHWLETGHAPSPDGDGACMRCAIRDSNPEPAGLESATAATVTPLWAA